MAYCHEVDGFNKNTPLNSSGECFAVSLNVSLPSSFAIFSSTLLDHGAVTVSVLSRSGSNLPGPPFSSQICARRYCSAIMRSTPHRSSSGYPGWRWYPYHRHQVLVAFEGTGRPKLFAHAKFVTIRGQVVCRFMSSLAPVQNTQTHISAARPPTLLRYGPAVHHASQVAVSNGICM